MGARLRFGCLIAAGMLVSVPCPASAATITFSELAVQPVDGLTFMGVTFDFKIAGVDSVDALFGSGGPGTTTYVSDPSLEGNSNGILTLDFASPVDLLQFGVALSTFVALTPGFTVELFDPALASLGIVGVNTAPLISFSEGLFSYSGAPVSRAIIDFNLTGGRFALDNLTTAQVPEPASLLLLGTGALGLAARVRRRRKQLDK